MTRWKTNRFERSAKRVFVFLISLCELKIMIPIDIIHFEWVFSIFIALERIGVFFSLVHSRTFGSVWTFVTIENESFSSDFFDFTRFQRTENSVDDKRTTTDWVHHSSWSVVRYSTAVSSQCHWSPIVPISSNSIERNVFDSHWISSVEEQSLLSLRSSLRFDRSLQDIDRWSIFAPNNTSEGHLYRYILDNEQTANHPSLIFIIRELNSSHMTRFSSIEDLLTTLTEPVVFTSDYELRLYTSSCPYLDEDNQQWKSDGMRVGPETNLRQMQCFSTHM
jgi:hypothetical protein